jgi:hypothetical protein
MFSGGRIIAKRSAAGRGRNRPASSLAVCVAGEVVRRGVVASMVDITVSQDGSSWAPQTEMPGARGGGLAVRRGLPYDEATAWHAESTEKRGCRAADDADRVAELNGPEDPEHPEVSVAHESGWALTAFPSGPVIWEDVEGDDPGGHRVSVSRGEVRRLFRLLARDELGEVASFGWKPGYGGKPAR